MTDIVAPKKRSQMMAGIRGKDTKPELEIRLRLHRLGFRYRIHDRNLPGSPDIVLKKYNAVIFIHGCFWHRHNCHIFKWPNTRPEFWKNKINKNYENDSKAFKSLRSAGWRVCIVWECSIKGSSKNAQTASESIAHWLKSNESILEIPS